MTTARDIVNAGAICVGERETLSAATRHTRDHDIDIARPLPEHGVAQFVRTVCSPAAITS